MMEALQEVNWALLMPIIILQFIVQMIALVDLIRHENMERKVVWVIVILLGGLLGSIIYFVFGRRDN